MFTWLPHRITGRRFALGINGNGRPPLGKACDELSFPEALVGKKNRGDELIDILRRYRVVASFLFPADDSQQIQKWPLNSNP